MDKPERVEGFRGDLLRLGRQARRMTQKALAQQSGVTQGYISLIEDDQRTPSPEDISRFSSALGFPEAFFRQPDAILGTGVGQLFHRRRKSLSPKELAAIHALLNVKTFAVRRMMRAVDWPTENVPVWTLGVDVDSVEGAAEMLRAKWYVPAGPVRSVSLLCDQAGVLVIPTAFGTNHVDAIGLWPADLPPMVFASIDTLQDRLRFNLMHEMAHLVLHQRSAISNVSEQVEDEANAFTSAFLMPRREIKPHLRDLSVSKLGQLKRHWRVSMAALLMRATQLGTIPPADQRRLWMEMSQHGWRTREPEQFDVLGEEPGHLYRDLVTLHRKDLGYSPEEIGTLVNLFAADVYEQILPAEPGLRLIG